MRNLQCCNKAIEYVRETRARANICRGRYAAASSASSSFSAFAANFKEGTGPGSASDGYGTKLSGAPDVTPLAFFAALG